MFEQVLAEKEKPGVEHLNAVLFEGRKDKVISLRIPEGLYAGLESAGRLWFNDSKVSEVARIILSFYFLPVMYELEVESMKEVMKKSSSEIARKNKMSVAQYRANMFSYNLVDYLEFLEKAHISSTNSLQFIESRREKVEELIKNMTEELEKVLFEKKET